MSGECQCETCQGVRNEIQKNVGAAPFPNRTTLVRPYIKTATEVPPAAPLSSLSERAEAEFKQLSDATVRQFDTGATRDVDTNKLDFDGFISPAVLEAYGTYMNYNRVLANGTRRDSDNWQKGIPLTAYMKSGWRHFVDWWRISRGYSAHENLVWAICGLLFNAMGYLHEELKKNPTLLKDCLKQMEERRAASRQSTT